MLCLEGLDRGKLVLYTSTSGQLLDFFKRTFHYSRYPGLRQQAAELPNTSVLSSFLLSPRVSKFELSLCK